MARSLQERDDDHEFNNLLENSRSLSLRNDQNQEELDYETAMPHNLIEREGDHQYENLLMDRRSLSLETERLRNLQQENEKKKTIVEDKTTCNASSF